MRRPVRSAKRFFRDFLRPPGQKAALARLQATLRHAPGAYCIWENQGTLECSPSFAILTGCGNLEDIHDLPTVFEEEDAALLSRHISRLVNGGFEFEQDIRKGKQMLRFTTAKEEDGYFVLWVQDITEHLRAADAYDAEKQNLFDQKASMEAALSAVPRPVWTRDAQQNIVWCNKTYAQAAGAEPYEVIAQQKEIGQPIRHKKKPDTPVLQPGRELAKSALEKNTTLKAQAHVVMAGTRLLMNITEVPLPELKMTLGLALDVTREEELESELRRFQSANRELIEQLRTAIGIFDGDQQLEFYNSAFAQLWGLSDQWLNSKPKLGDIMEKLRESRRLPEQADFRKFKQSWLDMFTRLIDPYEDMLYLPDGTALRMLVIINPMGGLMMTFEDVTSRLELESSYNTLIAVQKETLDNLAEAVAVFGGDGRLKLWNPAYSRLWGFNPEDLEGEPHINKVVEKQKPYFSGQDWEVQREALTALGLDRLMHEGRHERADETLVDYTTVPLPDGGVLITYTDVTDTVRVENALREKNAALEAAEQLKLDFLANVSYQLRTPLNAIMGFNEILDQEYFGPLNTRQKEYTRDTSYASQRLLDLINDILDLSSIEAGYLTLQTETVKIGDMLQSVSDLVSAWARKEQLVLSLSCPKNVGNFEADESRIKQAVINLIRNAIAYTPPGGTITLAAKRRKNGIEISVSDTGIGISKEDQMRILKIFEKAHGHLKSGGQRGGAGLGLALVQNIVTLHGGVLELDSEPGKGTTVRLFFPFEIADQKAA